MFRIMYLITILSVILLNSEYSFAEPMKKELGLCGSTISGIFEIEPNKEPRLANVITLEGEFCDNGRYEVNANYLLSFYDGNKKLIYDKYIYLNSFTFYEEIADKEKGDFTKTRIKEEKTSRIFKIPQVNKASPVVFYRIKDLGADKTYELKKIEQ